MQNPPGMVGWNNPRNPLDKNDPNYIKQTGTNNLQGLTGMAGNLAMPLLSLGTTMFQNNMRQIEQNSLDYESYQNDMRNSIQDPTRGGGLGLQLLGYGGKIKPKKYPMGGLPEENLPTPIQTEKGEKIIDDKGNIFDVKSKKLHKDMKKDEVTDIVDPNTYIISNRIMLNKKEADKIIIGLNPLKYKEGENKGEYKELKLGDWFTKDKQSLAELTEMLKKKFPTEMVGNKKGNIFAQATSDQNRASRSLILANLIQLNEDKKNKKSMRDDGPESEEELGLFPDGGWGDKIRRERDRLYPNEAIQRQQRLEQGFVDGQPINPNDSIELQREIARRQAAAQNPPINRPTTPYEIEVERRKQRALNTPSNPGTYNPPNLPMSPVTINTVKDADRTTPTPINKWDGNSVTIKAKAPDPSTQFDPTIRNAPAPTSMYPNATTVINNNPGTGNNALLPPDTEIYKQAMASIDQQMAGLPKTFEQNERENNNAFFGNSAALMAGTAVGIGGLLGQNPRVESPNLRMPNLPREIDKSYFDYQANQNNKNVNTVARAALSNTSDYSRAMSYILPAVGQAANATSALGAQAAQMNIGLESQYQQAKNSIQNQQVMMDTNAKNETNKFINNLVSQSAGLGVNAINGLAGLNNQRVNLNNRNRSEQSSRKSALEMQKIMIEQMRRGVPINYYGLANPATPVQGG